MYVCVYVCVYIYIYIYTYNPRSIACVGLKEPFREAPRVTVLISFSGWSFRKRAVNPQNKNLELRGFDFSQILQPEGWNSQGFPSGIIRQNWNDTEKISMAPAQG